MKEELFGVAQYFYHCIGEELPIRDILNRNGMGNKTEPHYENYTENWFRKCMNSRIKSINRNNLEYLFLMTKYRNSDSNMNGKLIVVGYLKRAGNGRWLKLSKHIPSGAHRFLPDRTKCGFFAGDPEKSRFVNAQDGYELENVKNGRYIWYIDKTLGNKIVRKLNTGNNIIDKLLKRTKELEKEKKKNNFKCKNC